MDSRISHEIHELMFGFVSLFHQKLIPRFRRHDDELPGLKKNHFKILGQLFHHNSLTLTEIGRMLDLEKGSVTSLVDHLAEKGLVARQHVPGDRRKSLVLLTEAGSAAVRNIIDKQVREIELLMDDINKEEIREFVECLRFSTTIMKKL